MRIPVVIIASIVLSFGLSGCYRANQEQKSSDTETAETDRPSDAESRPDTDTVSIVETDSFSEPETDTPLDSNTANATEPDTEEQPNRTDSEDTDIQTSTDSGEADDTGTHDTGTHIPPDTDNGSDRETEEDSETQSDTSSCIQGDITITSSETIETLSKVECIDGDLTVNLEAPPFDVHLPNLTVVTDTLAVLGNDAACSVVLENLTALDSLYVSRCRPLTLNLGGITTLPGGIYLSENGGEEVSAMALDLGMLEEVGGLQMSENVLDAVGVNLASLEIIDGIFYFDNNAGWEALPLDALSTVTGGVHVVNNDTLERIDMPSFMYAASFQILGNPVLTELRFEHLETTPGVLWISDNPRLETIALNKLESVTESAVVVEGNPVLSTLKLDALKEVADNFALTNNNRLTCDADAVTSRISARETIVCENAPDGGCGPDTCPDDLER
jgi:hypothetical protein